MNSNEQHATLARRSVQPDGSATAYATWFSQTERKYIRRSPYSIKWKLWGQMPIRAFRIGWMACEAWHRLKRKSQNDKSAAMTPPVTPDCNRDVPASFADATGSGAGTPLYRYLLSECVECGWQDQFREDLVADGQVVGFCDRCNGSRTFNCIERQNDQAQPRGN